MSTPSFSPLRRLVSLLLPGSAPVTTLMMLFCVAGWVLVALAAGDPFQFGSAVLLRSGSNFPALSLAGGEHWRLLSYMFLHGGLLHLAFNLYALWLIGTMVEGRFGSARFAVIYVIGGSLAGVASAVGTPLSPSVGASGAIMAIIGAGVVAGHLMGSSIGEHIRNRLLVWFAIIMVIGLVGSGAGLRWDNWAHGGGFVAGAGLGFFYVWLEGKVRGAHVVEGILATMLFLLAIGSALTPHVLYRSVPVPASNSTAMLEAARQRAWSPCEEAIEQDRWDDAVSACRDYRLSGIHWRRGHVVLIRVFEVQERTASAMRARLVLHYLDPELVLPSMSAQEARADLRRSLRLSDGADELEERPEGVPSPDAELPGTTPGE